MSEESVVLIHTDGACLGNPGPGGWGALLHHRGRERELSGGEPDTTNNRMELLAAIMALEALKRPCAVRLRTDDGLTGGYVNGMMPIESREIELKDCETLELDFDLSASGAREEGAARSGIDCGCLPGFDGFMA